MPVQPTDSGDAGLGKRLVDQLRDRGSVSAPAVQRALRTVDRHVILPAVSLREAYADDSVCSKFDASGMRISAASQPTIVAMMLEGLDVAPGHRILEIGAGYNAARPAELTGPTGRLTIIDVDEDIVAAARTNLATAHTFADPGADAAAAGRRNRRIGWCRSCVTTVRSGSASAAYDRVFATTTPGGTT